MPTEFTATVKSSLGDYTTLSAAEAGLQNDLTPSTIKVFSISAATNPTIAAGDTVLGLTSAATGTCVLVNQAGTQILIKTIAVSSFQSGEVVQKTTDAAKTVTLSNAGDGPVIGIACHALTDTTAVVVNGWTTDADNYIRIYAEAGQGHAGYVDSAKYNLTTSATLYALQIVEEYVRVEGLQVSNSRTNAFCAAVAVTHTGVSNDVRIGQCLLTATATGGAGEAYGVYSNDATNGSTNPQCYSTVTYGCINSDFPTSGVAAGFKCGSFGKVTAYNCTAYNCTLGFVGTSSTYNMLAINCDAYCDAVNSGFTDFSGTMNASTGYDASSDATATGTGSITNQISTSVDWLSTTTTNADFLKPDSTSTLKAAGTTLPGSGMYTAGVDGVAFASPAAIGAREAAAGGAVATYSGWFHSRGGWW